ncbi:hypothetical protein D8674_027837 [Pyrus ussuriensis x Pyrus communis]|uniref:Uncharacterized protein n=1 Tax=Pyrus ussuriensis x Pyrus communis TaxID=2448454 RepID=A0A5N5IDX3_9ROSA|nr:hypothetical protein D8674_027837 [Pyrus ussuriensis x Pyrus communis]
MTSMLMTTWKRLRGCIDISPIKFLASKINDEALWFPKGREAFVCIMLTFFHDNAMWLESTKEGDFYMVSLDYLSSNYGCKNIEASSLIRGFKVKAQALPWGKDVAIKNTPFFIQYMERKSSGKKDLVGDICLDLGDVRECLRNKSGYGSDFYFEDDFDIEMDKLKLSHDGCKLGVEDTDALKLSHECLSMIYSKVFE